MIVVVIYDRIGTAFTPKRFKCETRDAAVSLIKYHLEKWCAEDDRIVWSYSDDAPVGVAFPDQAAIRCPDGEYCDFEAAILFLPDGMIKEVTKETRGVIGYAD